MILGNELQELIRKVKKTLNAYVCHIGVSKILVKQNLTKTLT